MQNLDLFVEILGYLSTVIFLYATGLTDDKKLTFYYTIGCFILGSHLFMQGAISGGLTTTLSGVRNIIARNDKTGRIKTTFMFIFIAIFVYYCFNYQIWYELLVPFASVVMSVGFIYFSGNRLTACMMLSCSLWLIYGIMLQSNSIMILEVLSLFMAIFRLLKQNNIIPELSFGFKPRKARI